MVEKDLNKSTRIDKTKQKKANRIYNILIVLVSVLILSVAGFIFLGGSDKASEKAKHSEAKSQETVKKDSKKKEKTQKEAKAKKNNEGKVDLSQRDLEAGTGDSGPESDTAIPDSDPNVKKSYTNDSWKPVGTSQQGEHVTTYDQGTEDWKEMEKALAYGARINPDNITVWWLENNGSPNGAVGTVSAKDNEQAYRVYIEWVDGQGWKPVKVQMLKENDKKS